MDTALDLQSYDAIVQSICIHVSVAQSMYPSPTLVCAGITRELIVVDSRMWLDGHLDV